MPKDLKEELKSLLEKRAKELGVPDLVEKIADETVAQSEEEVLEFMQKVEHPALGLPALL
jgi:acetyl-CoA synthase